MTEIYLKDYLSDTELELIKESKSWQILRNSNLPCDDSSYSIYEVWCRYTDIRPYYNVVYAHKGETLLTLMLSDSKENSDESEGIFSFAIQAQKDGFYVTKDFIECDDWNKTSCLYHSTIKKIQEIKFLVFDTKEEWEDYYFFNIQEFSSLIEEDLFEGKKVIKWCNKSYVHNGFRLQEYALTNDKIQVETCELGIFLRYYWEASIRKKSESGSGDTVAFLLDNKEQIRLVAKDNPVKDGKSLFYQFQMTQDVIDKLCSHTIYAIKKTFANGDEPQKYICTPYCTVIFRIWLKKHMQICEQLGYKPNDEIEEEIKSEANCFVYLMLDEINRYYKIGISNNPKYRERTLQSEKPSIKLICAKEFPSRRIAEAIESALHKAYTAEHIRGEWFNLTAKDVQEITQTLA